MYHGMPKLGEAFSLFFICTNTSGVPVNAASLPSYRVYGPEGFLAGQNGNAAFGNSGAITNATNASPIVITSSNHGLTTGTRVTITGVGGNTNANGTFVITRIDHNLFSLDGSTGNGAYTSGGTWNVTGLYKVNLTLSEVNGYDAGYGYTVLAFGLIGSNHFAQLHTFSVS